VVSCNLIKEIAMVLIMLTVFGNPLNMFKDYIFPSILSLIKIHFNWYLNVWVF